MSDNQTEEIEEQVDGLEQRFQVITEKLVGKEPLTNEEGMDLLRIIAGLNANNSLTNEIMLNIQDNVPKLLGSVADAVMRRVGRTDQKLRKSVGKICDNQLEIFWDMIRMHAVTTAAEISEQNRTGNAEEADDDASA